MQKKIFLLIAISISLMILFLVGCNNSKAQIPTGGGLKIYNWSSGLGAVNETNLDKTKFSYSINLTNENEKTIFIKSLQPSINESIKSKLLENETVEVNQYIKPNEIIQITGEIIFDTKGLSKTDISKLEPFIQDIKVTTEETVNLNNN